MILFFSRGCQNGETEVVKNVKIIIPGVGQEGSYGKPG
jgi:hypothetical protein